jgi:hypothetical protein
MPFSTFTPTSTQTCPAGAEQTLDIDRPEMPELQFVLLVTVLCTSGLVRCNVTQQLCSEIFDRCWTLIHENSPPTTAEKRVLDLRGWTEVTLDAMGETIRSMLGDAGIRTLAWEHAPSVTIRLSTPESQPLIERFQQLYPAPANVKRSEL